jgi:hypothetical protein
MTNSPLALVRLACATLVLGSACFCTPPVDGGEGEGGSEGEGENVGEGEGEGEGEGGGGPTDPIRVPDPNNPNNATLDSDCDGLSDAEEFANTFAGGLRTSPSDYDSDDDGLADGAEQGRTAAIDAECPSTWTDADPTTQTSPVAADTDADCRSDGQEDRNRNGRVDPGEGDPNEIDSDGDGVLDQVEDANCNGIADNGETNAQNADSDGDGLRDGIEIADGLDPLNPDSDGDGILDGVDPNAGTPDADSDGDGIPDNLDATPNDPDSDDDGLCDGPRAVAGVCVDGEDTNLNGLLDAGETDPARADTDGDGLNDGAERTAGTNPRLTDSDGDLLSDSLELANNTNPNVADTDGDGTADGLEDRDRNGQLAAANPAGVQETDPRDPDTDDDGICDGPGTVAGVCSAGEDRNRNGRLDAGETDPRVRDADDDGDGLSNQQELLLGTNPNDADSDDDGINDGAELAAGLDPLLPDTDDDGINDGAEVNNGLDPRDADQDDDGIIDGREDRNGNGVRDAGELDPRDADSDNDGVVDGAEDSNQNGVVDPGELNPLDPNDVTPTIAASCGQPIVPDRITQATTDILLALDPAFGAATDLTRDGTAIGVTVDDASNGVVAFALRTAPDGATALAQLQAIEARLRAVDANALQLPLVQSFTTWDGFEAARATYTYRHPAGTNVPAGLSRVARASAQRGVNDASVGVTFGLGGNVTATAALGLVVVRRSATTSIVVGVSTDKASFDNGALTNAYRLEDIGGGTAQAQVGDGIGPQCDVFAAVPDVAVDFIWVLDNSGSMADEQAAVARAVQEFSAQLANSDVDGRVGLVTTEYRLRSSDPVFANAADITGECQYFNQDGFLVNRVCMCAFTSAAESTQFRDCVGAIGIGGAGLEGGLGSLKDFLAETVTPATTGAPSRTRIRQEAQVVAIMVSDAGDQTLDINTLLNPPAGWNVRTPLEPVGPYRSADVAATAAHWRSIFENTGLGWDPNRTNEPAIIAHGILCPVNVDCAGEEDSTGSQAPTLAVNDTESGTALQSYGVARYDGVISGVGGIRGNIAGPDGRTLANLDDIGGTIEAILRSVVLTASPYTLSGSPIASTLKVALQGPTVGACDLTNVPRVAGLDRSGFLYDAASNTIALVGNCRATTVGSQIALSYQAWLDLTGDPDGDDQPCGGDCPSPFICINDQCLCPEDCGLGGGLLDGQTCNAASCTPECLPDCGGCAIGQVCDVNSPTCSCACPADCNFGQALPSGFVCDQATCQPTCAPGGCAGAPPGPNFVCGASCQWECPDNCGGTPSPEQRCNLATCTIECSPDCNASCGGYTTCDASSCACECRESVTCAPGFAFDAEACDCTCSADALACPATHVANLDECRCDCGPSCNGVCSATEICSTNTCSCINPGG